MEALEESKRKYAELYGRCIYRSVSLCKNFVFKTEYVIAMSIDGDNTFYRAVIPTSDVKRLGAEIIERRTNELLKEMLLKQLKVVQNGEKEN